MDDVEALDVDASATRAEVAFKGGVRDAHCRKELCRRAGNHN